jgi:hypothetical protein
VGEVICPFPLQQLLPALLHDPAFSYQPLPLLIPEIGAPHTSAAPQAGKTGAAAYSAVCETWVSSLSLGDDYILGSLCYINVTAAKKANTTASRLMH